jgi:hypothetical protein
MAALSVSIKRTHVPGDTYEVEAVFTPSTSYPAGGEPLNASDFGMRSIKWVEIASPAGEDGTRLFTWDRTNGKLRIWTAIGTEAATSSDQSTKITNLKVSGI